MSNQRDEITMETVESVLLKTTKEFISLFPRTSSNLSQIELHDGGVAYRANLESKYGYFTVSTSTVYGKDEGPFLGWQFEWTFRIKNSEVLKQLILSVYNRKRYFFVPTQSFDIEQGIRNISKISEDPLTNEMAKRGVAKLLAKLSRVLYKAEYKEENNTGFRVELPYICWLFPSQDSKGGVLKIMDFNSHQHLKELIELVICIEELI